MKNKILSVVMAAAVLFCLCSPAAFASSMDNFVVINTYTGNFTDVSEDQWFFENVKTCYEYGLMIGTNEEGTIFEPETYLACSEAIVMADRIYMIYNDGDNSAETMLKADEDQAWYEKYVKYAIDKGIIAEDDFTDYDRYITRAEMAYIFANALPESELTEINKIDSIPDVSADSPYADNILSLYKAGVVIGNNIYCDYGPDQPIIRAEAGAIISRLAIKNLRLTFVQYEYTRVETGTSSYYTMDVPSRFDRYTEDGMLLFTDTETNFAIASYTIIDPLMDGYAINSVYPTTEDAEQMYIDSFADSDDIAAVLDCNAVKIKFGDTLAYRCYLTLDSVEDDGSIVKVYVYGYVYIVGDVCVNIAFTSDSHNEFFRGIVNSFQVNGAKVSSTI